jgi:hypothetical protein
LGRAVTIALWRANNKPPVELVVANLVLALSPLPSLPVWEWQRSLV